MAKTDDSIPPVPLPPATAKAGAVPPVEPKPKVAKPAAAATPTTTKAASTTTTGAAKSAPPANTVAPTTVAPAAVAPVAPASPAPAPTPQTAYAAAPAAPPQGLAIASMITGIAGIFLGGFFLASLAAIITGHMAQKRQPYARAFWLTGLITGYIGIGIAVVVFIFFVLWLVVFAGIVASTTIG